VFPILSTGECINLNPAAGQQRKFAVFLMPKHKGNGRQAGIPSGFRHMGYLLNATHENMAFFDWKNTSFATIGLGTSLGRREALIGKFLLCHLG
jgi:hypothetical protein